jgi:hypothetical protein
VLCTLTVQKLTVNWCDNLFWTWSDVVDIHTGLVEGQSASSGAIRNVCSLGNSDKNWPAVVWGWQGRNMESFGIPK